MTGKVLCPACRGTGKSESHPDAPCATCCGSGKTGAAMLALDPSSMASAFELVNRRYRSNVYMRTVRPRLNPKQKLFLGLDDLEVMLGGAGGGSKSDSLLLAALQYADVPGYSAILFRRTFTDLSGEDAIMDRATKWLVPWTNSKECQWSSQEKSFFFNRVKWEPTHIAEKRMELVRSGVDVSKVSDEDILDLLGQANPSRIAFGYMESDNDKYRYQGWAFHLVCVDELTQHPEENYTYLFSRIRRAGGAAIPLRMRSGTNPGGRYGQWVLERFITDEYLAANVDVQFSRIWYKDEPCTECHDGLIYGENGEAPEVCFYCDGRKVQRRVFVPARAQDNEFLDRRAYKKSLAKLLPVERARLEHGRWDISEAGGHFEQHTFRFYSKVGDHWIIRGTEGEKDLLIGREHLSFFITADTASKLKETNDYTAVAVWGMDIRNYNLLLLHLLRERVPIPKMPDMILELSRAYQCEFVMIEEANSGIGLLAELRTARGEGISLVPYNPHTGDKLRRAHAAIRRVADGRVFFPSNNPAWMSVLVAEMLAFPIGEHDDTVDALVQACHYVDGIHHRDTGTNGKIGVQATPGMHAPIPPGTRPATTPYKGAIGGLRRRFGY